MNQIHLDNARIFKALCDDTRLLVLDFLRSGEKCACDLLEIVEIGQSTLSHHMKIMVESGIVKARKNGKWTYYSICGDGSKKAVSVLKEITTYRAGGKAIRRCCE